MASNPKASARGKSDPESWSLPAAPVCLLDGCGTKPKAGPLCGKHSQYANEYGPESMPELSPAGWAWVMDAAREAAAAGDVVPFPLAKLALSCQAAVSRDDTLELLQVPGWARYRLNAPWVPDDLVLALAQHDRPDYDRNAVAWAANERRLPAEAYLLLATDPERHVRLRAAQGALTDQARAVLTADEDDVVAGFAFGVDVHRSMYQGPWSGQSPVIQTPAQVQRLQQLARLEGMEFTRLLRVDELPSWEGMTVKGFRHREALGYIAYAAPTLEVRQTALGLLQDGWADSLPALLETATLV